MKTKLLIGTILVFVAAGLWLGFEHRKQPVFVALKPASTMLLKPEAILPVRPVPPGAVSMVAVTSKSSTRQNSAPSAGADWSVVHVVADTQSPYERRMRAINSLSSQLSAADWNVLSNFLLQADTPDHTQLGRVLKNRLMDVLCALNPPPEGLGDVLAGIYQDRQQDGVIRDYAVQHMVAYYEQVATAPNSDSTLNSVQKVLWEATGETGNSIAGTALLALQRLDQEYPARFDQNKIGEAALQMAGSYGAGELTRITAYQVCAQAGTTSALPLLAQAVQNGETVSVRISAIGALGLLGRSDQISLLNNVLQGDEDRLKPAARHALAQIMARNN